MNFLFLAWLILFFIFVLLLLDYPRISRRRRRRRKPRALSLAFKINGVRKRFYMDWNTDKDLEITLIGETAKGKEVAVSFDAAPHWSISDAALATLTVSEDGLIATLVATTDAGAVTVKAAGAEAGVALEGEMVLELKSGKAVKLKLTAKEKAAAPVA